MATLLSALETQARIHLKEGTASFWTSAELIAHMNLAIKDLWGSIIDLNQEHFQTVDTSNVTLAAQGTSLTGVPSDVFRVLLIEPADTTSTGASSNTLFRPADYNSPEFINARMVTAQDATSGITIYYTLTQPGAPIAAPTVLTAPKIAAAMSLRFVYVPVIAAKTSSDTNPIPGESDQAIIAWTVAYARAKERPDRSIDPAWIGIYATEKRNMMTRMTPRQSQEPDVVAGIFDGWS